MKIYNRFHILFVRQIKGKKEMIIHIKQSGEKLVDRLIPVNLVQNFVELKANSCDSKIKKFR